ncbi:MAG TPA: hypothetical protein VNF06_01370 [Candidatus Aquilonibacter sp.]|nr:hypothetical protein [Candidatus Aquilonibacter sp.]
MTNSPKVRDSQSATIERIYSATDSHQSLLLQVVGSRRDIKTRMFTIDVIEKLGMMDEKAQFEFAEIYKSESSALRPPIALLEKMLNLISSPEVLTDLQGTGNMHHKAFELVEKRVLELSQNLRK